MGELQAMPPVLAASLSRCVPSLGVQRPDEAASTAAVWLLPNCRASRYSKSAWPNSGSSLRVGFRRASLGCEASEEPLCERDCPFPHFLLWNARNFLPRKTRQDLVLNGSLRQQVYCVRSSPVQTRRGGNSRQLRGLVLRAALGRDILGIRPSAIRATA